MSKTIDITTFTKKHINFFLTEFGTAESKYRFFDTDSFSNDCRALGFEMDCGNAFIAALGENAWSSKGLRLSIDRIEDVNLIGSALYSKWREYATVCHICHSYYVCNWKSYQ